MLKRDEYRILRIMKRIGIQELATLLNCHVSHISNYENGRTGMSDDKVKKYQKYIQEKVRE